jgi:hypothetical protein
MRICNVEFSQQKVGGVRTTTNNAVGAKLYVRVYVCMYMCMYACMCVCMRVCVSTATDTAHRIGIEKSDAKTKGAPVDGNYKQQLAGVGSRCDVLPEVSTHHLDIVVTSSQLALLTHIVDPDEESFAPRVRNGLGFWVEH